MPVQRTLLALLLLASVGRGAEVRTLTNQEFKGDLISIDAKEVVLNTADGTEKIPVDQVVEVIVKAPSPTKDAHALIELTDGSKLLCKYALKGKEAAVTLVGGQELKVPLGVIKYVLNDAHKPEVFKQFKDEVLAVKRPTDVLARLQNGQLNPIPGTFGDVDDKGERIAFTLTTGKVVEPAPLLANIQGMQFVRGPLKDALPQVCTFYDTTGSALMASAVAKSGDSYVVTTLGGQKIDFPFDRLGRFDYSKGKLAFLSDLTPVKVVEKSTDDYVFHYRRDRNLDAPEGGPVAPSQTMKMRTADGKIKDYKKGLAVHSHTELEYDLGGDYREFKTDVGFDEHVNGELGPVLIVIEGDGKELKTITLDRATCKGAEEVIVNIKDVSRLKIVVKSGTLLDTGRHVDLGGAQVSK